MDEVPKSAGKFQIVNLEDVPTAMEEINAAEENLTRLINGKVALVAYVQEHHESETPHQQ